LGPWNILGDLIVGLHRTKKLQEWGRLVASTGVTAFVAFWGAWGTAIPALHAQGQPPSACLVLGFGVACFVMAVMVAALWKRSPLTKGIPLVLPTRVAEEAAGAAPAAGGLEYDPNAKR